MYVSPPKLQCLALWQSKESTSNVKKMWEISAPPDNSLYWSLVLSYVIASPENSDMLAKLLGDEKEIKELMLKKKIPIQNLDSKSIKKQVMNFNPFKNQHSFYYNKILIKVFRLFSLRLNRKANEMKSDYGGEWGDDVKLEAARKMLKCDIKIYETNEEGNIIQFDDYSPVGSRAVLYLFKHSGVTKMYKTKSPSGQVGEHKLINTFGFGMSLNHVIPLRRDAVGHILKRTNLTPQIIHDIKSDFIGNGNFLVSLLEKDTKRVTVLSIYASPYIAWKLDAAGFVVDPCFLDKSGLSALYHCMGLDSTAFLHVLYDYASNNFRYSDTTTRNPDQDVLRALKRIRDVLQNDFSKSYCFSMLGDKKNLALKTYCEILCFNEYQRFVVQEIIEKHRSLSPQARQSAEDFNTRRKLIIKSLLEIYPRYFNYPEVSKENESSPDENELCRFQEFLQHSEYYENLDNYTCFLFFDNFLFLDVSVDILISAVQNLFLTVFGYSLFPKCKHGVHCTKDVPTPKNGALRVIPFIFRSKFLESAKDVLQKLRIPSSGGPSKSTKLENPNSVLAQITMGLKDLPEIKDEILIGRLKNYINIATCVKLNDADMKGVLTMERALQVLGETMNTSDHNSVIGHLLCSCLGDIVEEFFKIRNKCLSHYQPRLMRGKLSLEKEILRFRAIQDTLKDVRSLVQPVYVSQLWRITNYMVESSLSESKNIDLDLWQNMQSESKGLTRLRVETFIRNKSKYKSLTNNLLNYIKKEAENKECPKFQKIGQIYTLKFLFTFLANHCVDPDQAKIFLTLQELDILSKKFESKANATKQLNIQISTSEGQEIIKIVSELRKISDSMFSAVKDEPTKNINPSVVKTFFSDARRFSWFTGEEMKVIKEKISEHMNLSCAVKATLTEFSQGKLQKNVQSQKSEQEVHNLVAKIFATQKVKDGISASLSGNPQAVLKSLRSIKRNEQNIFKPSNDQEDDLDCLIRFSEREEGADLLVKIDFPGGLQQKVLQFLNQKIECLLERIAHLKSILIEEDEEILSLWNWGKSDAIKTHTRFLMCQRYRREMDVRASLELLLFDCMNILKTSPSLRRLWLKANELFTGACLRNILSHGDPILEIVGGSLDEGDLPSHFIDKMLELIEDGDALQILSDLWMKEKTTSLQQFESRLMATDPSLREVQKWMKKRSGDEGGWKDYLTLLPLK